jgi:beta-lactamase class A
MTTRRHWLKTTALAACASVLPRYAFAATLSLHDQLAAIERESGGRLGVALIDTVTGRKDGYRAEERFPMCSTFKVLAASAVLKRVDEGKEKLDRRIPITQADILSYAPVTKEHVGPNGMTISELCEAAITLSDNTAANLLLATLGGPQGVTKLASLLADPMTRLDRNEPTLNEAVPFDPRDTTTPQMMAHDLEALVVGTFLSSASRELLKEWLIDCKTGARKIRAGLPQFKVIGDKTGSGDRNTSNDIAVISPDDRPKILTIYLTDSKFSSADEQSTIIAKAASVCFPS